MQRQRILKNKLADSIFNPFYKVFLLILNFFIFLGDVTRRGAKLFYIIFFLPYRFIDKITSLKKFTLPRLFTPKKLKLKYFILGILFSLIIIAVYQVYIFLKLLPSPRLIGLINFPVSTQIKDRNGNILYEFYRDQNRTPIKLNKLNHFVKEATIAIEDKQFYNHGGISLFGGITRAIYDMVLTGQLQGGSTITQQLVKTSLLTPERTLTRKIKEMILAVQTERIFSKDQILEMYLNQVPYGGSAYGIEEASQVYFGKSAKDLTLSEAALLAGLPRAPSIYSPFINPQLAKTRRNHVLKEMLEQKYINKQEYLAAIYSDLKVLPPKKDIKAPHFVFYVKSALADKFGLDAVEEGGLRVVTSLDLGIEAEAEKILKEELAKVKNLNITNGAILVTKPATGEILAMVGSADYFDGNFGAYNATLAQRQPGSSIKPLMYSLALEEGYTPATIIDDSPVSFSLVGSKPYRPLNYDNRFHGKVSLRLALANSYNVPAVKVLNTLGVDNFVSHAQKLGITTWEARDRYGLSLTLGGGEVKMTDMAVAYGILANYGKKINLRPLLNIYDFRGKSLYRTTSKGEQVLKEEVAFIISDILSDNDSRRFAFGPHSQLEISGYKVAVKTGTTNDKRDNWTIGYTPDYLVAVWVGNNNNSSFNNSFTSGVTGAAPIWNRVMKYLLKVDSDKNVKKILVNGFHEPKDLIKKTCYFGKIEYFLPGTENTSCHDTLFKPTPTPSI